MAQSELEVLTESVRSLTGEIAGLRDETQKLDVYGRQNRRLIEQQRRIIAFLVVIGVVVAVLAIGFGFVAVHARDTAQLASRNAVNAEQVCEKANEARATTRDLWDGLFKLPSIPALTPAQQAARDAQVATVRARIATSYADQDCTKLGPQAGKK